MISISLSSHRGPQDGLVGSQSSCEPYSIPLPAWRMQVSCSLVTKQVSGSSSPRALSRCRRIRRPCSLKSFQNLRTRPADTKEPPGPSLGLVGFSGDSSCTGTPSTMSRSASCVAGASRFQRSLSVFSTPSPSPSRPWATSTIDLVVSLPPATLNGEVVDAIITATCPLSKMVLFMPLPLTAPAEDVASVVYDNLYR